METNKIKEFDEFLGRCVGGFDDLMDDCVDQEKFFQFRDSQIVVQEIRDQFRKKFDIKD